MIHRQKTNQDPAQRPAPDAEHQFASRVIEGLGGRDPRLDGYIHRRLSAARWQAVESAARARRLKALAAQAGLATANGSATLTPWWARLASLLPAVALALGLIAIDRLNLTQRIEAAAEIDAALLADDLPPAAYVDPGFAEFLKQSRP